MLLPSNPIPLGPLPSGDNSRISFPWYLDRYPLHLPAVSPRLPAMSMVQIPSSVHCIPLPERPGALKRISTLPARRVGNPGLGVLGVWPCTPGSEACWAVATLARDMTSALAPA